MANFWQHFRHLLIVRFDWHHVTVGKILRKNMMSVILSLTVAILNNTSVGKSVVAQTVAINFLGLIKAIVSTIVEERNLGHYELMKVNGLNRWAYKLSFIVYGMIDSIIPILLNIAGFVISGSMQSDVAAITLITSYSNSFKLLPLLGVLYFVTVFQLIAFFLFYSLMFNKPDDASDTAGFMMIFWGLVYYLPALMGVKHVIALYYGLSAIPSVALSFGAIMAELNPEMSYPKEFDLLQGILVVVGTGVAYFIAYLVFDAIKESKAQRQNQAQAAKRVAPKENSQEIDIEKSLLPQGEESKIDPHTIKDISSAKYYEPYQPPATCKNLVYLEGLSKVYGDLTAVDNLGITIFEKEIFCLLGHNGAGKSTTINMLTGLETPDSGQIFYDGKDFGKHYQEVRTLIGLCAQKDLIFRNLSADMNLRFIGILRGYTEEQIAARIEIVRKKVDLPEEIAKTVPAGQLSGGQKRKLCLGMAIFGDPKIIFLDEPTSGMDPESRRVIWKIIRELRNEGKCIILTTHHLDEADELSDRIAVMVKGKIFVQGTKNYLKKEFGVGYHLVIQPKLESDSIKFAGDKHYYYELVDKFIMGARADQYTAENSIRITLPFSQQKNFAALFKELETDEMIRISLEMTSLEDAFINIGNEEEKFLEPEVYMTRSRKDLKRESTVHAPFSVKNPPSYSFALQFKAMFTRQLLAMKRNPKNIFSFLMPITLLMMGTVISVKATDDAPGAGWSNLIFYTNLAISINSSIFCGAIVLEKERNIRYALKVMGCRRLPYWLGTYLYYLIIGVFWCFVLTGFFFIFGLDFVTGGWHLAGYLGGFMLYFNSLILMAFVYSFFFPTAITAFRTFGLAAFGGSFLFNAIIDYSYLHESFAFAQWPARIIGYLVAGPGVPFKDMANSLAYAADPTLQPGNPNNAISVNKIPFGKDYYFGYAAQLLQAVWFLILLIFFDSHSRATNIRKNEPVFPEESAQEYLPFEPEDMNKEINRIMGQENSDRIKVNDLKKAYVTKNPDGQGHNTLWAVKGISFGVEKGQILGLLGPNGAGKSTTFNIVTGKFPRSTGKVELLGVEIDNCGYDEYQEIGICPQVDFIWERLSVEEHLRLFGMIKGLSGNTLAATIRYFCEDLELTQYLDKLAVNLSGGNKRKLCIACSLIGSPLLQFFDEPSSGVDPVGRRFIWDLFKKNIQFRDASSILTTHSMVEAESLCHKIGIIVNGRFVCIGTPQYLKDRYGSGYRISISRPAGATKGEILKALKSEFSTIRQHITAEETTETFEVPIEDFVFSKSFTFLEQLKAQGIIVDFSIYNTTLEQIFIQFAKYQKEQS